MRLFIGLDIPSDLKQNILNFQRELQEMGIEGYWKSKDNFHLTLEFLGEIQPQSIAEISSVLVEAAKNKQPFILGLEGLGGFPSLKKPHTLWTAVNGNLPELFQLRDDIHQGLLNKGFQLENRPFKPHLTLASRPVLKNIDLSAMQKRKLGSFRVGEVILYDSSVIMGKRTYTRIKTVSFD